MRFNPFDGLPEATCVSRIEHLQNQLSAGATQITGPGGGAQFMSVPAAERMVWQLQCRLAAIRGLPEPPAPGRIRRRRPSFQPVFIDLGY